MFRILIVMMFSQVQSYVQIYQILYPLNLCSLLCHLYLNQAVKMGKKVTRLKKKNVVQVVHCSEGPFQGKNWCLKSSRNALLLLLDSPGPGCFNQRLSGQTPHYCDTYFQRSRHPVRSLRFEATLSALVLAGLPTVDFCVSQSVVQAHSHFLVLLWEGFFFFFLSFFLSFLFLFLFLLFSMSLGFKGLMQSKISFTHMSLNRSQSNASRQLGIDLL